MKVHVFRRDDVDLFAYSVDETGANIRPGTGWIRCGTVADIDKAIPVHKAQAVKADLQTLGYHLFRPGES